MKLIFSRSAWWSVAGVTPEFGGAVSVT